MYQLKIETPSPSEEIQNFAGAGDRKRLSGTALKAFKRLARAWRLTNGQSAGLLGVSERTWDRMKQQDQGQALNQDQLTRISALVGVYKGLHLIFADEMADRWVALPNSGPLFERRTPIDAMTEGGIPVMLDVRRYLDAVRGGL